MSQAFKFFIFIPLCVFILFNLTWLTSCRIIDNNVEVVYQFKQHLNIYPEKKIYHIGDTIWVSNSSHESFIINEINQEKISLNDKLLNIYFRIYDAEFKSQWFYPNKPFDIYIETKVAQLEENVVANNQYFDFNYGCWANYGIYLLFRCS